MIFHLLANLMVKLRGIFHEGMLRYYGLFGTALCMPVSAIATDHFQPFGLDHLRLTFLSEYSDEFDQQLVDFGKWVVPDNWGEWSWSDGNIEVSNGSLKLWAEHAPHKRDGNIAKFTSGIIVSKLESVKYGYFEARIKGASGYPGLVPAFWLFKKEPLLWTEIDIVEMHQSSTYPQSLGFAAHLWRHPNELKLPKHFNQPRYHPNYDPNSMFGVYGLRWDATHIRWYVNGELKSEQPHVSFDQPLDVVLSLGLRQQLLESKPSLGRIAAMEIDYVRVWSGNPAP